MDINHVVIIGNLTKDVELAYTNGGMAIANGAIAVNRSVKRGDTWEMKLHSLILASTVRQQKILKATCSKEKESQLTDT